MEPSKCVVVQAWMRSGEPFISSSVSLAKPFQGEESFLSLSLSLSLTYLHDVFAVGTTVAPKVDGSLYDGTEQTGA
jgi:hypothetical protein